MSEKKTDASYYRSLTRRILMILIVVAIIPLILISGFLLTQFRHSYQEKIYDHLGELVLKHKQNIDTFLTKKLNTIRFLASTFEFSDFHNDIFLREKLTDLQREFGTVFEDLGVVDENGRQISYAGPFKLENADYSDAEWFREAIHNRYYISDVFMGLRGKPHFIISVRGDWGGKQWLLRSTIDFLSFNSLVENLRIGRTGFAFILNRDGKFQTQSPFNSTIPENRELYNLIKNGKPYPSGIHIVEKKDTPDGIVNILVGAFMKEESWLMVYQQDKSDALSNLNRIGRIALVILAVAVLSIIISAILLSQVIVKRFFELDQEKQLMNRQVIETGKLASVGELASGIAHEINNPVAIMIEEAGWIEDLLEDEDLKEAKNMEEFRRALRQIHDQGIRCREITHKLLSFARKSDSCVQEVQINEMIEEVAALSGQKARYENVQIGLNLKEGLPVIHISSTEIQQILLNLMNNAIYALGKKEGNGRIDISTSMSQGYIHIDIADNGCGIPAANLERIFDPFFTTKPVGKGTGLGLSICYGIIRKMDGDIEVESAVDKGTVFHIRLPVRENGADTSKSP